MNSGGKRNQCVSWWAASENQSSWLGAARRSDEGKPSQVLPAGKSGGAKLSTKQSPRRTD
jgi:hypothetical protein